MLFNHQFSTPTGVFSQEELQVQSPSINLELTFQKAFKTYRGLSSLRIHTICVSNFNKSIFVEVLVAPDNPSS